jgi:hypothetical protein
MQTHTFLKEDDQWFIDLPEYIANGGSKADLRMIAGADTMLDIMTGAGGRVTSLQRNKTAFCVLPLGPNFSLLWFF